MYKAVHVASGCTVAIKKIMIDLESSSLDKKLALVGREVQILYKLSCYANNQYTVKLRDAFVPAYAQ